MAFGCHTDSGAWPEIQETSPLTDEPVNPIGLPTEKCKIKFNENESLKQVAVKAAEMFEVCQLSENEIRSLLAAVTE